MNFTPTEIEGVVIIEPNVFGDSRGYFLESFNQKSFESAIGPVTFVQDNESRSVRGVLRGLHFQRPPFAQAKLVRCISGRVLDIAVDIREGSPTFGQHIAIELTGENKRQLFIPHGFAHGFAVLSNEAIFAYKVDNYYSPSHDDGIAWNDPEIGIDWQLSENEILLSAKDKLLKLLSITGTPFTPK
jgi:dTDP-4-dehydrorhamnose 3,5-epimerase